MRRLLKRIAVWTLPVVAVLGGLYGWIAYRYWTNPPKLTRNFAAELNAPILAIPEDRRAWPIYREVITHLPDGRPESWQEWIYDPEKAASLPEAAAFILSKEVLLERARRASELPALGYLLSDEPTREDRVLLARYASDRKAAENAAVNPPSENPQLMTVLLYSVGESHELRLLLHADAVLAAKSHIGDRMIDDLASLMRIANHLRQTPFEVCDILSMGWYAEALRAWGRLMQSHPAAFTDASLIRLEVAARDYASGDVRVRFDGERMGFYDVVQRIYTDDGNGDGYLYMDAIHSVSGAGGSLGFWSKVMAPLTTHRFCSRKEAVNEYEQLMAQAEADCRRPLWECTNWPSDIELTRLRQTRLHPLTIHSFPSSRPVHTVVEQTIQQRDAVLAVSAMIRYRLKNKNWPKSLNDLVPGFLPSVPLDRFIGQPLKYHVSDDGPVLYSVGSDHKDDGGRAAILPDKRTYGLEQQSDSEWHFRILPESLEIPLDGDFVLWPVAPNTSVEATEKVDGLNDQ